MPRNAIDPEKRSKTHTFSSYDPEWAALENLTIELKLHTPFDVVRKLVAESKDAKIRKVAKEFTAPRKASERTLTTRAVRAVAPVRAPGAAQPARGLAVRV